MKVSKKLGTLAVSALMAVSVCTPVFAGTPELVPTADIQLNGVMIEQDAILYEGSTYLLEEGIEEVFGVECNVNGSYASLTVDGKTLRNIIPVSELSLISIRDVAESLGYVIGWDDSAKALVLIDVNQIAKDSGETFDIMKKYIEYSYSNGKNFKTDTVYSGGIEMNTDGMVISLPFDGKAEGYTSQSGQSISLDLNVDLPQLNAISGIDEMSEDQKEIYLSMLKEIENNTTEMIYDFENMSIYFRTTLSSLFGIDDKVWLSMDLAPIMELSGSTGMDLTGMIQLIENGDFEGYMLSTLKSIPANSVTAYEEMCLAYDLLASMLGDSSFVYENGAYKSTFAMNEDGAEVTFVMTMGTNGSDINSCTISMRMTAEDILSMDMNVSSDRNLDSKATFTMEITDLFKMFFEMDSDATAISSTPSFKVPEGDVVLSINDMLNNAMAAYTTVETVQVESVPEPLN